MTAYYNEYDPHAAAWLRELIKHNLIAPGVVDERSIEDVEPGELAGFTQCHFFAGIGGWSLALRRAGWPDDRPIWTGSCPCQPFSAAGAGAGFADERHLWPAFHHLIRVRRPAAILGEQVASRAADPWIDLVHADLAALGYAFGAVAFPSAGVGAPHVRDRAYWVADAAGLGQPGWRVRERDDAARAGAEAAQRGALRGQAAQRGAAGRVADADEGQRRGWPSDGQGCLFDGGAPGRDQGTGDAGGGGGVRGLADAARGGCGIVGGALVAGEVRHPDGGGGAPGRVGDADGARPQGYAGDGGEARGQGTAGPATAAGVLSGLANPNGGDAGAERQQLCGEHRQQPQDGGAGRLAHPHRAESEQPAGPGPGSGNPAGAGACHQPDGRGELAEGQPATGPTNGHWRTADWLFCRDGKWRPVEPGTFPLAHGVSGRVGRLRGYGNAVNVEAARVFIQATGLIG